MSIYTWIYIDKIHTGTNTWTQFTLTTNGMDGLEVRGRGVHVNVYLNIHISIHLQIRTPNANSQQKRWASQEVKVWALLLWKKIPWVKKWFQRGQKFAQVHLMMILRGFSSFANFLPVAQVDTLKSQHASHFTVWKDRKADFWEISACCARPATFVKGRNSSKFAHC